MAEIPVYGLSGLGELGKLHIKNLIKVTKARKAPGKSFSKWAGAIKNAAIKKAVTAKHMNALHGLDGIFNTTAAKIANGTATTKDAVDFKKAKVLLTLEDTDYDAFRLASIYMPYVSDIDDKDGGFYFPSQELAEVAAAGEEELVNYCNSPNATDLGKIKIFKKVKNAVKKAVKTVGKAVKTAAKATVNTVKTAVKSTVNAVKATGNLVKAGAQAVTGHGSAAKATLKKATTQAKAAITQPIKQAAKDTKDLTRDTIINPAKTFILDPLKQTIKIAGKVFKVLFIKINPVTVLIRNSIRGLIALNFLGMATRLNVGMMTKEQALKEGYDAATYDKAVTAVNRLKKLYKKMGGNTSKLEKSIRNGAKKKPLFKKDVGKNTKVNFANDDGDGETSLGEPATIAAMIAACVSILVTLWNWIKSIVVSRQQKKEEQQAKKDEEERKKRNAELYDCDVNGEPIVDQYGQPLPKGTIERDKQAAAEQAAAAAAMMQTPPPPTGGDDSGNGNEKKKSNTGLIIGGIAAAGLLFFMLSNNKKSRKRR